MKYDEWADTAGVEGAPLSEEQRCQREVVMLYCLEKHTATNSATLQTYISALERVMNVRRNDIGITEPLSLRKCPDIKTLVENNSTVQAKHERQSGVDALNRNIRPLEREEVLKGSWFFTLKAAARLRRETPHFSFNHK